MTTSLQVQAQNIGKWNLEEISEDTEFSRQQTGPRLYRQRCRITVSRALDGVSALQADGELQSTFPGSTKVVVLLGDPVYAARATAMTGLGVSSSDYGDIAIISVRGAQSGPDGSEALRQVVVFECTTGWNDYPYDAEFEE